MSAIPDKIYLQWHGDSEPNDSSAVDPMDVTWSQDRVFPSDIEYIKLQRLSAICVEFYGQKYPVITKLDEMHSLVAHPNGAAITDGDFISVIYPHDQDTQEMADLKRKAIRVFHEWAWPKLRGQFDNKEMAERMDGGAE
jgi:hypothetical protein